MYVQQTCSLLFFPKRNRINRRTGMVPIYARLMIDGQAADRAVKDVRELPEHHGCIPDRPADPRNEKTSSWHITTPAVLLPPVQVTGQ